VKNKRIAGSKAEEHCPAAWLSWHAARDCASKPESKNSRLMTFVGCAPASATQGC
jgi:hypothetical protein